MKTKRFALIFALVALGMAFGAQAHDPKEHMKDAEKPDCNAMEKMDHSKMDHSKMDHSKMDMDDPVMQAMMKQCMAGMGHDDKHQEDMTDAKKQRSQHQH